MITKIKDNFLKIIHNKTFRKISGFIFNYINWTIFAGLCLACVNSIFDFKSADNILDKLYYLFFVLVPISFLFLFKQVTVKYKKIWVFILMSIISTIHVGLYFIYLFIFNFLFALYIAGK